MVYTDGDAQKMEMGDKDILHTHLYPLPHIEAFWVSSGDNAEDWRHWDSVLLQFCNLFTEGHILCSARERALNTASFLMPSGFVLCVLICVFVLPKSETVWEKEAVRKVEVEDFVFREAMMNWQRNAVPCMFGQGDQGGQTTGMSDEGCETVTGPQGTWTVWHVLTSSAMPADPACLQKPSVLTVCS